MNKRALIVLSVLINAVLIVIADSNEIINTDQDRHIPERFQNAAKKNNQGLNNGKNNGWNKWWDKNGWGEWKPNFGWSVFSRVGELGYGGYGFGRGGLWG